MKCIIIDDEPIARKGIEKLVNTIPALEHTGSFENTSMASAHMTNHTVDLIFLDIQMPGLNGLDFAKQISKTTLVIFTTAYVEFALDSYEVDAVDYLVKPIQPARFEKAVEKAVSYHKLLFAEEKNTRIERVESEFMFIKSERRYLKITFKDILFIEGLKDYVIIHTKSKTLFSITY